VLRQPSAEPVAAQPVERDPVYRLAGEHDALAEFDDGGGGQLAADRVGRPDQIELIFGRRVLPSTTGVFATRVVTRGVDVTVNAFYRHSRVKQYFKLRHEVARCEWTRRQEGRLMSVA
jgi:hypothetical protein